MNEIFLPVLQQMPRTQTVTCSECKKQFTVKRVDSSAFDMDCSKCGAAISVAMDYSSGYDNDISSVRPGQ